VCCAMTVVALINAVLVCDIIIIIIIFIRHNMTGQQGMECTKSSPTMCNKIKDIKTTCIRARYCWISGPRDIVSIPSFTAAKNPRIWTRTNCGKVRRFRWELGIRNNNMSIDADLCSPQHINVPLLCLRIHELLCCLHGDSYLTEPVICYCVYN